METGADAADGDQQAAGKGSTAQSEDNLVPGGQINLLDAAADGGVQLPQNMGQKNSVKRHRYSPLFR